MNLNSNKLADESKWTFSSFEMPDLWYNEDEIYNLMQTFKRPRNIDPTSYDFKNNFWSNLLLKYAIHHHVVIINEKQMKSIFTKEFKSHGLTLQPLCASTILSNMEADDKVKQVSAFEGGSLVGKLMSGLGWAVTAPISWSYNRISSAFYLDTDSSSESERALGDLVIVDAVDHCMREFMQWLVERTDLHLSPHIDIVSLPDYSALLASYFPHESSRNIAQRLLERRRQIELVSLPQARLIKIADEAPAPVQIVKFARAMDAPLSTVGLRREVVDQISGLVQLRQLARKLEADERAIEDKIERARTTVKMYLRAGKKDEAKSQLRRAKVSEKMLERKRAQLQNVEHMLLEIEASSDNMAVFHALSNAAGALKARSMDVDSVQDAMAEIGDALADQEEINASICAIGDAANDDLLELEAELAGLLAIDESAPLPPLPDVPTYSPSSKIDGATRTAELNRR